MKLISATQSFFTKMLISLISQPKIEGDPFKSNDVEGYFYPMVLVQIQMCNERELSSLTLHQVNEQSISAVCQLDWPKAA
ncbi:hypothetical protein V6N13_043066 [Hibiscus sabdariffa]